MTSFFSYRLKSYGERNVFIKQSFFLLFILLMNFSVYTQDTENFDEVPIAVHVPGIGSTELNVLIRDENVYLPIKDLFDYLKIKNYPSSHMDSLRGFFIHPENIYLIDQPNNSINYKNTTRELSPGELIRTETCLYLYTEVMEKVFGLECNFNFRSLSLTLRSKQDLPAIREMQQSAMRKNLKKLKGEKIADTFIKKQFSFIDFGMADWMITSTQESMSGSSTRAFLNLGGTIAGGETNIQLNYFNRQSFKLKDQLYRWRYVNNEGRIVKQITAGRIISSAVASVFAPVNGIQITNSPTTYRKSFGSYRYTGTTQPGWTVELYVNNILLNYEKADASGLFAFDIPVVYGNSSIVLKYYGLWGEESSREENIYIPFNFLPHKRFEYTLSSGIINNGLKQIISRGQFNYGLGKRITIGGGTEHLSSPEGSKPMPFLNTSIRLGGTMIIHAEYMHGVRSNGIINYRLPGNFQFDINFTRYNKGQSVIWHNYLEERKATISGPIRLKKINIFSRLSFQQFILPKTKFSHTELVLSTTIACIGANFKTNVNSSYPGQLNLNSHLSLSYRLPVDIRITTQAQFDYSQKKFSTIKLEAEKKLFKKGFLNFKYEKNVFTSSNFLSIGFRYDFSFGQIFFSAGRGSGTTISTQTAKGSLVYEHSTNSISPDDQNSVGKGGIIVLPFLDLNGNGKREPKEPKAFGLKLRVSGGRIHVNTKDTTIYISRLDPYIDYFIENDNTGFENIAWKIKKPIIKIIAEPNRTKIIHVPVSVLGEASGTVYLKKGKQKKGISRILVNFYDSSSKQVAQTLTETDGYFSFLGLPPGKYRASVDTGQLNNLQLVSLIPSINFVIEGNEEGTIADGFTFQLESIVNEIIEEEVKFSDIKILNKNSSANKIETKIGKYQDTDEQIKEHKVISEIGNENAGNSAKTDYLLIHLPKVNKANSQSRLMTGKNKYGKIPSVKKKVPIKKRAITHENKQISGLELKLKLNQKVNEIILLIIKSPGEQVKKLNVLLENF